MTVICGGGASEPNPGVAGVVTLTAGAIGSLFGAELGPIGADVIGSLASMNAGLATNTFCGTDPPADPNITASDILDALVYSDPTRSVPAVLRLNQWVLRQMWWKLCRCSATATPAPPVISLPTVTFTGDPGLQQPATPLCIDTTISLLVPGLPGGGGAPIHDIGDSLLPVGWKKPFTTVPAFGVTTQFATPIPATYQWTLTLDIDSLVTTRGVDLEVLQYVGGSWSGFLGAECNATFNHTLHATQPWLTATSPFPAVPLSIGVMNSDVIDHHVTCRLQVQCTSPLPSQPCCPPDASLQALLNRILGLVQTIWDQQQALALTRLPRYTAKTVHAGLTGNGSVNLVDAAIAFRVDVVTDLTGWPKHPGDPNYYLSLGFVTSFAEDVPIRGFRLVYGHQTYPLAAVCTSIGYTLPPGVQVNIVELVEG